MSAAGDLGSADAGERLAALLAVAERGTIDAGEISAICNLLGDRDRRVQRRAAETLAAVHASDFGIDARLEQALSAADRRLRWGAAFCQACTGRPSRAAFAVWVEHLASRDRDLRWAAHALVVRHLDEVGEGALASLRSAAMGEEAQRRKMALYCLRDIGVADQANTELARRALDDTDIDVRLAALSALPRVATDPHGAARTVCAYLEDDDPRMRRVVAATLGKLGWSDERVGVALEAASRSADPGLRRAALGALNRRH